LAQPNVRLLLADDVGLGKTIEAGLIMTELLVRRRIHRILVLAPPGLREQWQRELWQRFALDFRIVDGPEERRLKNELGGQCNPWSLYPRIIASPHYLRSAAPLKAFLEGAAEPARPHAPWDLLVVDEAHHLAPRARGPETLLTQMLRTVAPWFDHRVFLTATPHDGYSATYTGLLEILDPVRFRKTTAPTHAERRRQREVVIRRTRRTIAGRGAPMVKTTPIPIQFQDAELEVLERFRSFRERVLRWGLDTGGARQSGALLTMEVLSRRLLSSWSAFHASFQAFRKGLHAGAEVKSLPRAIPAAAGADLAEPTWLRLTQRLGGWLATYYPQHLAVLDDLADSLAKLAPESVDGIDSRRDAWLNWLRLEICGAGGGERAVIFTQYVATLESLTAAVDRHLTPMGGRYGAVHGQTSAAHRREVLSRFCIPSSDMALLLCTDVLAEGLNLHHEARFVFHYDLPWNPAVMQQRVGRLDRLGQQRPVRSFHFRSRAVEELRLHRRLEDKLARISGDIGPTVPLLPPLPRPSERAPPTLFQIGSFSTEESGPAVCARTDPLRETRAGIATSETHLGATPQAMREAVETVIGAVDPSPAMVRTGQCALEIECETGTAALASLTSGPFRSPPDSLLLDFRGDCSINRPNVNVARVHPGHPLLKWLLARHGRVASTPWLALMAGDVESLPAGLLLFALESAGAQGNPLLHQALLPLWLPLPRAPEDLRVGPLEPAARGVVNRVLTGQVELHAGLDRGPRTELTQLAAESLRRFAKQRNVQLEKALSAHQCETVGGFRNSVGQRAKELSTGLEQGPSASLADLVKRQQRGVLFPEMAAELAIRKAELHRELTRTTVRRERLLAAIEEEAKRADQTFATRYQLIAPLTISCEGIVYFWPGGRNGS